MAPSIAIKIDTEFSDINTILKSRGLTPGGSAQKALTSAAVSFCEPYVPVKTGALRASVFASDAGEISYTVPYARKQYYEGRADGIRGRLWFERMKADRLGDLLALTAAACKGEVTKP